LRPSILDEGRGPERWKYPLSSSFQVLLNGLSLAAIYVFVALGFTLLFGIMKVVNFAHGAFVVLGGYALFNLMSNAKTELLHRPAGGGARRHGRRADPREIGLPPLLPAQCFRA